jgi:signal transduction histidine kinase/phage shock protein PspC (stress-responsive transcriptional regulator)
MPTLDPTDRVIAGVASGIGRELGIETGWIRLAFVVLFAAGGWGGLLYVALWGRLAFEDHRDPSRSARWPGTSEPKGRTIATRHLGFWLVVLGCGAFFERLPGLAASVVWPLGLMCIGALVAWQRLIPRPRSPARTTSEVVQILGGLAIVGLAVLLLLRPLGWSGTGFALPIGVGVGMGLLALSTPWWLRLLADLDAERQARVRSEERAEVAAHLHDSVLQTLSLIQRHADDPQKMVNLARRQERELRNWLDPGRVNRAGGSVRGRLDVIASDVEDLHGVPIEVVVVGDALVDDRLDAMLGAAREAMVNAAKHSGAGRVDCYAEVSPTAVEVFVRDGGDGFDPAGIPADRRGIRESIERRMSRAGGTVTIHSAPGDGTEIELRLPRPSVSVEGSA